MLGMAANSSNLLRQKFAEAGRLRQPCPRFNDRGTATIADLGNLAEKELSYFPY
jgi:hypothetical protein